MHDLVAIVFRYLEGFEQHLVRRRGSSSAQIPSVPR
jgi:hypothetical protein